MEIIQYKEHKERRLENKNEQNLRDLWNSLNGLMYVDLESQKTTKRLGRKNI